MAEVLERVTLRERNVATIPAVVRETLHVHPGDLLEFVLDDDGRVYVRGARVVPADQAWFWTEQWQQGEREASEDVAAGRVEQRTRGFRDDLGTRRPRDL